MKTLLHIDSSPRAGRSHSRQLTTQFARAWSKAHPGSRIIHRELGLSPVPFISEDWIAAAFSDPTNHTLAQRLAIAASDELVDELLAASDIVIGAPMYNLSVPASLKAWIDQVVRVGRTVEYPSRVGLLKGRKVTIITTRGGTELEPGEPMAHFDAQVPYLRSIFNFLGITDITIIYAGSLAGPEETRLGSLEKAARQVEEVAGR